MIVFYGCGLLAPPCSCSWRWNCNSSSSIYRQRQQNQEHHSLTKSITKTIAVSISTSILMLSLISPKSDAADLVFASSSSSKQQQQRQIESEETLLDVPQELSSQDGGYCSSLSTKEEHCKKKPRIQRPKSRKAEACTIKCVTTCIRGGGGSPGEGPLNVRRPLVVFKEGFRSRQYCLIECSDICNLIGDGDSGP